VKFWTTAVLAGALAAVAFAQGEPPKDPPPDPPKDGEPVPPVDPMEEKQIFQKTWMAARGAAQKKGGYAILWVTKDKGPDGMEDTYNAEVLMNFWANADNARMLGESFGAWRGTYSECMAAASAQLAAAKVEEGPAMIFIDPDDGSLVDVVRGPFIGKTIHPVLKAVFEGRHRKGCEAKINDKDTPKDEKLELDYANALYRNAEYADASKHYAEAKASKDPKTSMLAKAGEAWIKFRKKEYKKAAEEAMDLYGQMPPQVENRAEMLYIVVMSHYYLQNKDEMIKAARTMMQYHRRMPYGMQMIQDQFEMGYDFTEGEKKDWTPAKKDPPRPEADPR
jgi:uncharacterized protein YecT (DUF1311 family)